MLLNNYEIHTSFGFITELETEVVNIEKSLANEKSWKDFSVSVTWKTLENSLRKSQPVAKPQKAHPSFDA